MNEAIKNINNSMWPFAIALVLVVVLQAVLFMRNALQYNKSKRADIR